jgi:hypothetical protein
MGNRLKESQKKGADYSSTPGNNRTVQSIKGGQMLSRMGTFPAVETSTPLHQPARG